MELMDLLDLLLNQNYFTHNKEFYSQLDGLAMGSPLSGLLADVYLNYFENSFIFSNNRFESNIVFYGRYVDDTFMIYNGTHRQIDILHNYLNSINDNMKFTLEVEDNGKLNFLDLTVSRHGNKIQFGIYRKPTATDIVIHATSHHPVTHKMAAFHSMIGRLLSVPLSLQDYYNELSIIKHIASSNGYKESLIDSILRKRKKRKDTNTRRTPREGTHKYIPTPYTDLMPKIIAPILNNNSNLIAAYRTTNNILNILRVHEPTALEKKTGVYKLICDDCDAFYLGQTGRGFFEKVG